MDSHVYQVSVTFHDVAAYFSAEEWSALEDWQKDIYRKVMMEIHTSLQGMGFEILNPDVLFRIKKVKDLYIDIDADRTIINSGSSLKESTTGVKQEARLNPDLCRRRGGKVARHPACSPDLLLRIKQDAPSCYRDLSPHSPAHNAADTGTISVLSKQKEAEKEINATQHVERSEVRNSQSQRQITSQPIKQETMDYIKVSVGEQNCNSTLVTPRGEVESHAMTCEQDYSKGSTRSQGKDNTNTARGQATAKPIKQEEVDYAKVFVSNQRPEETTPSRESDIALRIQEMTELWTNQADDEAVEASECSNQENQKAASELEEVPDTDYFLDGSFYRWNGWHNHVGILSPLSQHRKDRHYQCNECAKTFSDVSRFLRHQMSHTGGRPYHCRHCIKTFRQPYELMVHQRVHTGEKPYQCMVCGKKFIKNSILKVHSRIHTGERPYKCTQCCKSFVQSHHLKTHQRTHLSGRVQNY